MGESRCVMRSKKKRKTEQDTEPVKKKDPFRDEIVARINMLNSSYSSLKADRSAAIQAIKSISKFVKNEKTLPILVDCGVIPALVKNLHAPPMQCRYMPYEHEVEAGCAKALGLLAAKPEIQQLVADCGALPPLINLLKRHGCGYKSIAIARNAKMRKKCTAINGVITSAADAITVIARENSIVKKLIRLEGGITPLVELLQITNKDLLRAVLGALRTLVFEEFDNKEEIMNCNAIPFLILTLKSVKSYLFSSKLAAIQSETIGFIANLVCSSPNIKETFLLLGGFPSVLELLSSLSLKIKKEAALLVEEFVRGDTDSKVCNVLRDAIPPLMTMLHNGNVELRETAARSIRNLAQGKQNLYCIAQDGGLEQLLKLVDSRSETLQYNAVFTVYSIVGDEENASLFIKLGGITKLLNGKFSNHETREYVDKAVKKLENSINGKVLSDLLDLMQEAHKVVQRQVALALAHLCSPADQRTVFIDNNGIDLLFGLLESDIPKQQLEASLALYKLGIRATVYATPMAPTTEVHSEDDSVNNPTSADVTFLVEDEPFYAHKICLLRFDAFRSMLDGGYRETHAKLIKIPNIKRDVFKLMMRFIYNGDVDVDLEMAQDVLICADQYLMNDLKLICERTIAQHVSVENVWDMYKFSETLNATSLRESCIIFLLGHFETVSTKLWYTHLIRRIMPEVRYFFTRLLTETNYAG